VIDAGQGPGLALEARAGVAGEGVAAQHLDRDRPLEARIARAVDHAHRAAPGHAVDREPADRRGRRRRRAAGAPGGQRDPGDDAPAVGARVDVGQRGLERGVVEPAGRERQRGRVVEVRHAASWIGAAAGGNGGPPRDSLAAMSSVDARVLAAFVAGLPDGALAPDAAALGAPLAAAVTAGLAACPELDAAALAGYLARRCPPGVALDHLERLDGAELALAWACADGATAAIARFEARYFGELRVGVARLGCTADELAEVTQAVRRALFADAPPRLLALTARGELRALLRLMAARAAIDLRRRTGRAPVTDGDDDALALLDDAPSPSAQVARGQHRDAFRAALTAALADAVAARAHDPPHARARRRLARRPGHHAPGRPRHHLALDRRGARDDLPRDPARAHRPARRRRRRLRLVRRRLAQPLRAVAARRAGGPVRPLTLPADREHASRRDRRS
jgi:hypothetical protein